MSLLARATLLLALAMTASHAAEHQLQHLVLFKWKDGTTPAQAEAIAAALTGLKDRVPGVVALSYGAQNSHEPVTKTKGYQNGLTVTFVNAAARDAYLIHPAHVAAVAVFKPYLEDVTVMDYDLP